MRGAGLRVAQARKCSRAIGAQKRISIQRRMAINKRDGVNGGSIWLRGGVALCGRLVVKPYVGANGRGQRNGGGVARDVERWAFVWRWRASARTL
jgi:hypothetical protein